MFQVSALGGVVRHQAFLLNCCALRLHAISYSHSRSSAACSSSPEGGRAQKFKQLSNKGMGAYVRTAGGRKRLLCCSVPSSLFLRHTKCDGCESILTDDRSVEYKLCQMAFQGDYSINTNGQRRRKEISNGCLCSSEL